MIGHRYDRHVDGFAALDPPGERPRRGVVDGDLVPGLCFSNSATTPYDCAHGAGRQHFDLGSRQRPGAVEPGNCREPDDP